MTTSVSVNPVSPAAAESLPPDVLIVSETEDEDLLAEQLINQRRAQAESPEGLRLARAL